MSIKTFIHENRERFLAEWFELLRIPSVSARQAHRPDMQACAERLRKILLTSGATRAEVMPTGGNPVVYA
ncbi:MAG: peptidase M20, partial [Tannerella sp.]|nr:peptidase M20 [Tannerella sp.]